VTWSFKTIAVNNKNNVEKKRWCIYGSGSTVAHAIHFTIYIKKKNNKILLEII
jgi:hypothetical protein